MLHVELPFLLSNHRCRNRVAFLAFLWICGLLCGIFFTSAAGDSHLFLMRTATHIRVSIIGLAAVLAFPLAISAAAVYLHVPVFLFPICFFKAFSFGCCSYSVFATFGNAGWLVRGLFLFSDSCMMVPLLWFWYKHLSGKTDSIKRNLAVCTSCAVFIGTADYFLISPYLTMLMNH